MERRLNEVEWSSTSVPNNDSQYPFSANCDLTQAEKDRIIRGLESEVEAQVIEKNYL
jgi:hypothetical protein